MPNPIMSTRRHGLVIMSPSSSTRCRLTLRGSLGAAPRFFATRPNIPVAAVKCSRLLACQVQPKTSVHHHGRSGRDKGGTRPFREDVAKYRTVEGGGGAHKVGGSGVPDLPGRMLH